LTHRLSEQKCGLLGRGEVAAPAVTSRSATGRSDDAPPLHWAEVAASANQQDFVPPIYRRLTWPRRDTELFFQIPPTGVSPAIGAGDPCRRRGIDPAVYRLVALAQLLPYDASRDASSTLRRLCLRCESV
jgi:hypothetical protein